MKQALITGIAGRDGFYLAELLLDKGYAVHGIKRHQSLFRKEQIDVSYQAACVTHPYFYLQYADLTDAATLAGLIQEIQPDEVYNLGFMSAVNASFEALEHTAEVNGLETLRLLETIRISGLTQKTRLYQTAASVPQQLIQSKSKLSSYPTTKLCSYDILSQYRATYGMFACNGMLSSYDRLRQGELLLTQKVIQSAVRIALGLQGTLYLDALDARRDWGHTRDYVEAMWLVLQQSAPEDFVIATGVTTTVREFVRLVFAELSIDIIFQGTGAREAGYVAACHNPDFSLMPGQTIVAIDPIYYRSFSVEPSLADTSKARRQLGWKPRHDLCTLVRGMVQHDLELFRRSSHLIKTGHQVLL